MSLETPVYETDWLKRWTLYAPKSVAIHDAETGEDFSYERLYRLSCRTARALQDRFDLKKGDRVAVLSTNEVEYLPLFFAVQRLGAILVPINFRLTSREIDHIIEDSGAELLIYQSDFQKTIENLDPTKAPEKRLLFDGPDSLRTMMRDESLNSAHLPVECGFEDPCMILYTSGTTGAPKGAIITHKMIFWNAVNTTLRLNISQNDVTLSFLPFFHTGGWNVLITPFLHRGAKLIFIKKFEPERVLRLCDQKGATILFGVPTTMDMMFRTPAFKEVSLKSLRYAIVGGEPMPIELIKTWQEKGVPIRQGYGLTEFGPNVFSLNEEDSLRKIGSIGFPNFYIDVKVVDGHGQDVGENEIGELLLAGPVCTTGYWKNNAATTDTIRNGWLHTGDLVRCDSEGYFYVVGRKKDMFISGGENVYPVEVEQILGSHAAVREIAVIGVPDEKWGEVGKAFVTLVSGQTASAEELIEFCQGKLAKFKIPKSFEFLSELPKGDSGKILKRQLRDRVSGTPGPSTP